MLVSQAYYSGYTDWHWFWKGVGKLSWRQRPYLQGTMPSLHRWIVSELHWIRGYSACLLVERSHHIFWGHRCFLGRLLCRESKKKQDVNKCEVALGQLLPSQSRAAPGHPLRRNQSLSCVQAVPWEDVLVPFTKSLPLCHGAWRRNCFPVVPHCSSFLWVCVRNFCVLLNGHRSSKVLS